MATNAGSRMGALLVQLADFRTRCDARVHKWLGRPRRASGARRRTGHEHEQLFRTLIEHSPDFIVRYNRRCEVVYANPAMRQIPGGGGFRLALAAEVGTPAGQLDYEDCIRVTLRATSAREAEFQYDGPDGDVRWVAVRFVPEPGEGGCCARCRCVFCTASAATPRRCCATPIPPCMPPSGSAATSSVSTILPRRERPSSVWNWARRCPCGRAGAAVPAIVDLGGAGLVGAEALLRWNHPVRGLLTPDIFIKVAEDNGTIVEIGDWVLAAACEAVVRWNAGCAVPMRISVNVSGRQFVMNDLARSVQAALAASGCAPQWLTLEITESLLLENDQNVGRTLDELNEMGVAIAIDDFGTGYSAISYLGHFPISTLKIDRSFVRDIDARGKNLALVKAMISMAESLGLDVVAEGVETQQQADVLASLDCHRAQGYLFGRPMPEAQFVAYAQSGKVL